MRRGEPRAERGGRPPSLVTIESEGLRVVRSTTDAIRAMMGDLPDLAGGIG